MSRPVWLIESGVYGPEAEPLAAEIRRQGMGQGERILKA
jgi:hypothetical protein